MQTNYKKRMKRDMIKTENKQKRENRGGRKENRQTD